MRHAAEENGDHLRQVEVTARRGASRRRKTRVEAGRVRLPVRNPGSIARVYGRGHAPDVVRAAVDDCRDPFGPERPDGYRRAQPGDGARPPVAGRPTSVARPQAG